MASTPLDENHAIAAVPCCAQCGAPLPIDWLADEAVCARCGAHQPLDAAAKRAMRAHVSDVRAFIREELAARYEAAFYRQNERAGAPVILGTLGIAFALAFSLLAFLAVGSGLVVSHVVTLAAIWVPSLAAFTVGWGRMFNVPMPTAMANERPVQCAGCGAIQSVRIASDAVKCRHCKGTLVIPVAVVSRLLRTSSEHADRARTEEAVTLEEVTKSLDRYVRPSVAGVCTAVPVGLGVAVWLAVRGGTEATTAELTWMLALPFAVALPFLVGAPMHAGRGRRSVDALADRLAARAG